MTLSLQWDQLDPFKHFAKAGDTGPSIVRTVIDPDSGLPIDMTDADVVFVATEEDGVTPAFYGDAEGNDSGEIRYTFAPSNIATAGHFLCEFQISNEGGQIRRYPVANVDSAYNHIHLYVMASLPSRMKTAIESASFDNDIEVDVTTGKVGRIVQGEFDSDIEIEVITTMTEAP